MGSFIPISKYLIVYVDEINNDFYHDILKMTGCV